MSMADPSKATNNEPQSPLDAVTSKSKAPILEDDSDPDFDDLDDVLDQFSANAPAKPQQTSSQSVSAPPTSSAASSKAIDPLIPSGPKPNETEEEFVARLTNEMSTMLSSLGDGATPSQQSPEELAKMGKELEEFTHKMEQEGIQPEDLLKAILGEEKGSQIAEAAQEEAKNLRDTKRSSTSTSTEKPASTAFEDTIRRTISRLETSDTEAKNATAQSNSKSEEDMLAEMLKALDSGSGGDDENGLSKMFLDMMQQLTHKDMLYEPMKELHVQYPAWLASHKPPTLPQAEYDRYSRQSAIVADMVKKFEEPNFSDDDPQCREYVWEKMQEMQGEGAPPEELVKNPFPGTDFGGIPGLGGGGSGEGPEEGCATQ